MNSPSAPGFGSRDEVDPSELFNDDRLDQKQERQRKLGGGIMGFDTETHHELLKSQMEALRGIDHRFEILPLMTTFGLETSIAAIKQLTGLKQIQPHGEFRVTWHELDLARSRTLGSKNKSAWSTVNNAADSAVASLAFEYLGQSRSIDHAAYERLLSPKYLPTYGELCRTLELPNVRRFQQKNLAHLESIAYFGKDKFSGGGLDEMNYDEKKMVADLSLVEFCSLFRQVHRAAGPAQAFGAQTGQTVYFSKEFISSFADYLSDRHAAVKHTAPDPKAPILLLGGITGQLARFLNESKKLPVEVLWCSKTAQANPYNLFIPPSRYEEFKPNPVTLVKDSWKTVLDKYKPSLVLLQQLPPNQERTTERVRQCSSVAEYLYIGLANSALEGNPWTTWGDITHAPSQNVLPTERGMRELLHPMAEQLVDTPPSLKDDFQKEQLPHLSRWLVGRFDSELCMGVNSVTSFTKRKLLPSSFSTLKYALSRFVKF